MACHYATSLRTWCHHGVTLEPRAVHRPRGTLVVAQEANDTRLGAWKKCGEWKGSAQFLGPVGTNVY